MALFSSLQQLSRALSPCVIAQQQAAPSRRKEALSPAAAPSPVVRRTANFQPTMFNYAYIKSLNTAPLRTDLHESRRDKLRDEVSRLIIEEKGLVDQLELIDSLQQLSLAYLFEKEIRDTLSNMNSCLDILSDKLKDDVHATSLLFRLLRERDFDVSQDVLVKCFKDEHGGFKSNVCHDIKGMLSLYEATFLAKVWDEELDKAREFAEKQLGEMRLCLLDDNDNEDRKLIEFIDHALELPLHWRVPRLHSLWFINAYERKDSMDPKLLELAKLDFNMVQRMYKMELKEVSGWWKKLGLANEKLKFARNWPVESYLWTVGLVSEPHFSRCRKEQAKMVCFIHVIDDIYDVYGSLDELEIFTKAIQRWEMVAVDELPEYMKPCFLALLNTVNEIAYNTFKNKGLDILCHLKRAWSDICQAFLEEARWYNRGYIPTLEEYMNNAYVSVAAPLALVFSQCLSEDINQESLEKPMFYPPMARYSSTIFRLYDDLGTSKAEMERGDVAKSVQCFMDEKGVDEAVASEKIKDLIYRNWKLLNGEQGHSSQYEESFRKVLMNLPRMAQFMYHNMDGNGESTYKMKDLITSLLIEPIPLETYKLIAN